MQCNACGESIEGAYLAYHDARLHPECFKCAVCGAPIPGPYVEEGAQPYHPDCHEAAFNPRCALCGGILRGTYLVHEGRTYCREDFDRHVAPRCSLCGQIIKGPYSTNEWGQTCCGAHGSCFCPSCGRWSRDPAPGGSRRPSECACPTCLHTEIGRRDLERYGPSFASRALALLDIQAEFQPFPIRLVSRLGSGPRDGEWLEGAHQLGQIRTEETLAGSTVVARHVEGIDILSGLPRHHFESVLAHEVGHLWLFERGFSIRSRWQEEGFCQLLAHTWLASLGTPEAAHVQRGIEAMSDGVYGAGFNKISQAWHAGGTPRVLEEMGVNPPT